MGYTPLDGLMMGTRSGSVDPGLLIHVLRHRGLSADDLERVARHAPSLDRREAQPRQWFVIGVRQSRPKARGRSFTPGAAWRRLYSAR